LADADSRRNELSLKIIPLWIPRNEVMAPFIPIRLWGRLVLAALRERRTELDLLEPITPFWNADAP
jgi:hypothetical protein